jgi:hypothetical protein
LLHVADTYTVFDRHTAQSKAVKIKIHKILMKAVIVFGREMWFRRGWIRRD